MLKKAGIFLVGLLFIAPSALILIAVVYVVKFFHNFGKYEVKREKGEMLNSAALNRLTGEAAIDPFHNSRPPERRLSDTAAPVTGALVWKSLR